MTLIISSQKIYGLYGLKHHIVEMRGGVTDAGRTNERTNEQTLKIELLSQWKLEAEFRKYYKSMNKKQIWEISLIKADLRQSTRRERTLPRMPRPPVNAVATPPTQ